jgi:hypothetical protein
MEMSNTPPVSRNLQPDPVQLTAVERQDEFAKIKQDVQLTLQRYFFTTERFPQAFSPM